MEEVSKMSVTQAAHAAQNQAIPEATRLRLFQLQVEIRHTEKRAYDLFLQNLVKGTSHLALGQEAVAAGFAAAMNEDDYTFCTYRGHHHTLARGASMQAVLGELMGRQCGLMKGKGGSMHLTSVAHGVMGSYAIVGAHLPIAAGAAWSAQYRGTQQVAVAFFGDGATNIGTFHEALNLAQLWNLPALFVLEDNKWAESTPERQHSPIRDLSERAKAFGMKAVKVDGQDVEAVYKATRQALDHARSGKGPVFMHVDTVRFSGHYIGDPQVYRPKEEARDLRATRDPIEILRERLGVTSDELEEIDSEVTEIVEASVEFAKNGTDPAPEDALKNVYA